MAATAQSLFDSATCFSCLGPVPTAQTLKIGILTQLLEGLGGSMTPQELIDEASCYICLPGVSQVDAIELALLSAISEAITGSGSTLQQVYQAASLPAAPNDPTKPAVFYPDPTGTMLEWSVTNQAWE